MKTFKLSLLSIFFICFSIVVSAQTKTEKIKVSGECGMCKTKIEKAAKAAGATYAVWDVDAKELTVKYKSTSTNTAKIEKAIAAAGYDTKNVKATDEAYDKLHGCCKYERTSANEAKADCCKDGNCADCKEGKCTADMKNCTEGKCEHHSEAGASKDGMNCCKKA